MEREQGSDRPDGLELSGLERSDEIELSSDEEVVDARTTSWAPGEPAPGEPADEILYVHQLTETEPPADSLDIPDDGLELPLPDMAAEVEKAAGLETEIEAALTRTFLARHDLEARVERFDEQDAERVDAERPPAPRQPGEFVCSHCGLLRDHAQLADPERGLCRDCVEAGPRSESVSRS
jgi:hypothetical protein